MITSFSGQHEFLSNFYLCHIARRLPFGTYLCPSAEHAFQAAKPTQQNQVIAICNARTPAEAKRLGQTVTLRSDWNDVRKRVMMEVVLAKFTQNPELAESLCATDHDLLVEGNTWHDNYWGDCRCGRAQCRSVGANYLGRILMAARDVLRRD